MTPFSYVVIFQGVTVPEFISSVDKLPDVINWYSILPQTVFLVSNLNASQLTRLIRTNIQGITRLLVLDANTDRNGWLPEKAWDFLRKPGPPK